MREHGPVVLRVCRAVLGSDDEADDAWQETFVAALHAYPTLDRGTDLRAWLVTVAHRRAVDVVRARVRRGPVLEPPGGGGAPGEPVASDAASDPVRSLEAGRLRAAVAGLPERQRWAVALHHLGGLSYAEVAAVLGGTEAAARRAGADGVATLRRTGGWA